MLLLLICIKFSHIIPEEQKYERQNEAQEIKHGSIFAWPHVNEKQVQRYREYNIALCLREVKPLQLLLTS